MSDQVEIYRSFVRTYLGRSATPRDGVPKKRVTQAAKRLGVAVPSALIDFYATIGGIADFCTHHNRIFEPEKLSILEGYLLFMDENQSVVSWGIHTSAIAETDPEVWQRNNTSNEWYSEELTLTAFFESLFNWYREIGAWKEK